MHPLPERSVLATRSPCRPNPIGIIVAEILSVKGSRIKVTGLDALNRTPILDIKPYEEHFDSPVGIEREREPGYKPNDDVY
jgi:tRNA (adenine37-N6)-methyltransferase